MSSIAANMSWTPDFHPTFMQSADTLPARFPRLARQTVWRQLPVRQPPRPLERERIDEDAERWDGMA